MKKFFLMAVMAVAALTASAQKGEFHVTPHISLGYAHISNSELNIDGFSADLSSCVSGSVGADVEYMITDMFGLSAGVDYNYIQTLKATMKAGSSETDFYATYSYLNIPVLAQVHFGEGWAIKAGFQPMFMLDADLHADGKDSNISFFQKGSLKDHCESVAFAVPVGISYTFETPITVDLRCNIPVSNIDKEGDNKMLGVIATVGYRF